MVTGLEVWAPCDSVPPSWVYEVRLIQLCPRANDMFNYDCGESFY